MGSEAYPNILGPGIWLNVANDVLITSTAPIGRHDTYSYKSQAAFGTSLLTTPALVGGPYGTLYAGYALYIAGITNADQLISFVDASDLIQCQLRLNALGQLYFVNRALTTIGSTSTYALVPGTWNYVEAKVIFSTGGGGTCEARVNGVVVVSTGSLTNATTVATASAVGYYFGDTSNIGYARDFYVVDGAGGANTTYLGDISVQEIYDNGPGVNQSWLLGTGQTLTNLPLVNTFTLTSVTSSTNVFAGTITGGAADAYVGYNFNVVGFGHSADNVVGAVCTNSSATELTLSATGLVTETNTAYATFQCATQIGINQTGTRPNSDNLYVYSNTAGQIMDFTHQTLSLTGVILGIEHLAFVKKDDAGTKTFALWTNSSGTVATSSNISPGNTYTYYNTILETDPNTSTQWSVSGLNAATFGIKELA